MKKFKDIEIGDELSSKLLIEMKNTLIEGGVSTECEAEIEGSVASLTKMLVTTALRGSPNSSNMVESAIVKSYITLSILANMPKEEQQEAFEMFMMEGMEEAFEAKYNKPNSEDMIPKGTD